MVSRICRYVACNSRDVPDEALTDDPAKVTCKSCHRVILSRAASTRKMVEGFHRSSQQISDMHRKERGT